MVGGSVQVCHISLHHIFLHVFSGRGWVGVDNYQVYYKTRKNNNNQKTKKSRSCQKSQKWSLGLREVVLTPYDEIKSCRG